MSIGQQQQGPLWPGQQERGKASWRQVFRQFSIISSTSMASQSRKVHYRVCDAGLSKRNNFQGKIISIIRAVHYTKFLPNNLKEMIIIRCMRMKKIEIQSKNISVV
jgi:hypothetical protein